MIRTLKSKATSGLHCGESKKNDAAETRRLLSGFLDYIMYEATDMYTRLRLILPPIITLGCVLLFGCQKEDETTATENRVAGQIARQSKMEVKELRLTKGADGQFTGIAKLGNGKRLNVIVKGSRSDTMWDAQQIHSPGAILGTWLGKVGETRYEFVFQHDKLSLSISTPTGFSKSGLRYIADDGVDPVAVTISGEVDMNIKVHNKDSLEILNGAKLKGTLIGSDIPAMKLSRVPGKE